MHGAEALLALEAADRIREAARRDGCTEREVFFAEPGADWSRFRRGASNLSLFASKRLRGAARPDRQARHRGRAAPSTRGARRLPEDAITLVMLPELDWQQRKSKWFEALERAASWWRRGPSRATSCPTGSPSASRARSQRASLETLEWLADRVEGNLLAARQEVEKLALLLPAGEVALAAIRDAVTDVSRFERDAPARGDPRGRRGAHRARGALARRPRASRCRCCSGRSPRSCAC